MKLLIILALQLTANVFGTLICKDQFRACRRWASVGECLVAPAKMLKFCPKSCGDCSGERLEFYKNAPEPPSGCWDVSAMCKKWSYRCDEKRFAPYMNKYCNVTCGVCEPTYYPDCNEERHCKLLSSLGECLAYPKIMLQVCPKSCGDCGGERLEFYRNFPTPPSACWDFSRMCKTYKKDGHCEKFPEFMNRFCNVTCGLCVPDLTSKAKPTDTQTTTTPQPTTTTTTTPKPTTAKPSLTATQPVSPTRSLSQQDGDECNPSAGAELYNSNRGYYNLQQAFAEKFYRAVAKSADKSENLIVSPLSVAGALTMVLRGARGNTAKQLTDVLAKGLSAKEVDEEYQRQTEMLASLKDTCTPRQEYPSPNTLQLQTANRIYVDASINAPSVARMKDVVIRDIVAQPDQIRQEVNNFVAKTTRDKIKELLPTGSVDKQTLLIIANALYLKAEWIFKFTGTETEDTFVGSDKKVTYLNSVIRRAYYAENSRYQKLGLFYKWGELAFVVCLPRLHESLSVCETAKFGIDFNRRRMNKAIKVKIPKLKVLSKTMELKGVLTELGLGEMFSAKADFGGFSEKQAVPVNRVYHKATIELNNKGTEASAATAALVGRSVSRVPKAEFNFTADRPFHFYITHVPSNTLLFVGRYMGPK